MVSGEELLLALVTEAGWYGNPLMIGERRTKNDTEGPKRGQQTVEGKDSKRLTAPFAYCNLILTGKA